MFVSNGKDMVDPGHYIAHWKEDGSPQFVEEHLRNVAELARGFAGKIGLARHGEILGLLHDLGKYSESFQDRICGEKKAAVMEKVDHATAGAQFIWRELQEGGRFAAVAAQFLALCVASHHGGLIDCLTPQGEDRFGVRMGKEDAGVHLSESAGKMDNGIRVRVRRALSDPALVGDLKKVLGAINEEEKIVDPGGKDIRMRLKGGLLLRMLFSCLIDADRTDTADFENPAAAQMRLHGHYPSWDVLTDRLETRLSAFQECRPVDRLRRQVSEECLRASERGRGVFALTVPTGGGKTLSSLRFALHHARKHGLERIIYVAPYTTIIDQNAGEIRDILEPAGTPEGFASVVLEHHSNLTPEKETPRSRLLSENWDAPVIVTTVVQFMEALFGYGTMGVRRLHRMANAVLVFDEVQTLPVRTVHLFCNAVSFLVDHAGSTAVLCTATQPLLDQVDKAKGALSVSDDGQIISNVGGLFRALKRVEVVDRRKSGGWRDEEIADLAAESARASGSCLIVVNTKSAALSLYRLCKEREPEADVCHLSSAMCPAHRMEVLERIGRRIGKKGAPPEDPGRLICVSTQLIEAGVDVDFGSVIRSVAGLDSIAQAAGRCNRHGRPNRGTVTVVNPAEEDLGRLEDIRVGRDKAIRLLDEFADDPDSLGGDLLAPEAISRYFRYYFFDRKHLMDYPVSAERDDTLLNMLSVNSNAVSEYQRRHRQSPGIFWRQSFMTAAKAFNVIDESARGMIIPWRKKGQEIVGRLCSSSDPAELRRCLHEAQRYSVNVFPHVLDRLMKDQAVMEVQKGAGVLYLADARYYSDEFGLGDEIVSEPPFLHCGG